MSIFPNSKASLTKPATTQRITTQCSNFFKVFPKALGKRSLKIRLLKHMTKWRRKWSVSWPPNVLSMPYTNNQPETPLLSDQASRQTGRCGDNTTKATKTNNRSDKVLDRPLSILLQRWDHGTINQFLWISIKLEHLEEIGGDGEEVRKEEMWPEWTTLEPREGYRVCVSIVENKGTLLTIVPLNRNAPTHAPHNLLIGAQKTMKATWAPPWWNPFINNWTTSRKMTKKNWWPDWELRREIFQRPNLCSLD